MKKRKKSELKSFVKWLKVKKAYSHFGINLHRPPETLFGWIIASHDLIFKLSERRRKRLNIPEGGHYSNNSKIEFKGCSDEFIELPPSPCSPTIGSVSKIRFDCNSPEDVELLKKLMQNGQ